MLRRKVKSNDIGPESAVAATAQLYEQIASRAYELYEMRGAGGGDELGDWLTAEREILAGMPAVKAEAADSADKGKAAATPEPRKKSSKLMLIGGSRKKAGATAPRSPAKPKSVQP